MGLFNKQPKLDEAKVKKFWEWFSVNERNIRNTLVFHDSAIGMQWVAKLNVELKKVLTGFQGDHLDFDFGHKLDGKGGIKGNDLELCLFHLKNRYLKKSMLQIKRSMPSSLSARWSVTVSA
jgi:hypothetical protein